MSILALCLIVYGGGTFFNLFALAIYLSEGTF